MLRRFLLMLLALALLASAALGEGWVVEDEDDGIVPDRPAQAQLLLQRMTLEEKIWQLLMVTPEALTGDAITQYLWTGNVFSARPVGGVVIFGQNIVSEDQLRDLTSALQLQAGQAGKYPLFIAVSEEGGAWSRVANKLGYPKAASAVEAGKTKDDSLAYAAGESIARYLKPLGINLDLAPVCDVQTAEDAWIRERVYGKDAQRVSGRALQMARGLRDNGVTPCFSHFPGQGSVNGNLNNREVVNTRTLEQMRAVDWIPFRDAIADGAGMIMVSNAPSRAAGDGTAACLSAVVISRWLREELGYQGVVITDSLRMGAITTLYKPGRAAVDAVQAGADMILLSANPDAAAASLLKAVQTGEISEARIDQSVARVLALKIDSGLIH